MPTSRKVRVAVIGYGRMGRIHEEILLKRSDVDVVSVFDPHVKTHKDDLMVDCVEEIFSNQEVDAVYISTPNIQTAGYAERALDAGKHVFCEKPLGRSVDEALRIKSAHLRSPHLVFKVGLNHRYLSHFLEAKKLVNSGEFGKLLWLRGRYGKGSDNTYLSSWRSEKCSAGGGILLDQGIHMLDLMLNLIDDEILDVKSIVANQRWDGIDTEDNAFVLFRSVGGVMASFHSSLTQYKHIFSLEMGLESGLIEINGVLSSTRSYGKERLIVHHSWEDNFCREETITYASKDYYTIAAETDDFIGKILSKEPVDYSTIDDAIKVMSLVERVFDSAE